MSATAGAVVRRASPADVDALVALMHEFYAESGHRLEPRVAAASFLELLSDPALGCVWIACSDAQPVGHAVLTVRYTMEHGGRSGYVDDLYVRASLRRRGIARAMLQDLFAESRARGCRSMQVEAGSDNAAALALYARFGLTPLTDGRLLLACALGEAQGHGQRARAASRDARIGRDLR